MNRVILHLCLVSLPGIGWGQPSDTLDAPLNFGAWQPQAHPQWAVGMRARMGGISYWNAARTERISRMVLHTMPSVHYFIAPSWALGVQAELWGLSTGNDTAFRARAEGSALTFSVRKYWWLTDTKIYRRPYAISLLTEALIGGTNLHFLPQGEIQTGQRGQGLQHLYGGLLIGARFQCLPRVYVGINRGIVWSVHEGALRVAPPVGMELALELIW